MKAHLPENALVQPFSSPVFASSFPYWDKLFDGWVWRRRWHSYTLPSCWEEWKETLGPEAPLRSGKHVWLPRMLKPQHKTLTKENN